MTRFDEGRRHTRTVILPFGSTEEHGLHLPLCTDNYEVRTLRQLEGFVERVALPTGPPARSHVRDEYATTSLFPA